MIHSFRKLSKLRTNRYIFPFANKNKSNQKIIHSKLNSKINYNKTNRLLLLLTLSKKKKKRKKDTGFRFIEFPSDLAKN